MSKEDSEKLLGGYATGTLTDQERKALFDAALTDQTVFNALGNEQALKELLDNPDARRRLLKALQEKEYRQGIFSRLLEWKMRPAAVALAGGMAVVILAVVSVTRLLETLPQPQATEEADRGAESATPSEEGTAGKRKDPATAKSRAKDQFVATSKAAQKADAKQNVAGGRAPLTSTPAPQPLAPADAPAASEPGSARDMFYGIRSARRQQAFADRPSGGAATEPEQARKSASAESVREGSGGATSDVASTAKLEASTQPPLRRLGLRYTVRQPAPGSFTLAVEVNQDAYLYVLTRDATGATRLLFPTRTDAPQVARVERDKQYLIPPTGLLVHGAEHRPRVIVVVARTPQSDLQGLPAKGKAGGTVGTGGKLLREEVIESRPGVANEKTVYVVEAAPSPSLSVEIPLPSRQ